MQYTQLYGATRIPGLVSDSQVVDSDPNYIIVMHRGNAFVMETKDVNGNDLNASQIYFRLLIFRKSSFFFIKEFKRKVYLYISALAKNGEQKVPSQNY